MTKEEEVIYDKEQEKISKQLDLMPKSKMEIERELSTPDNDEVMTNNEPTFISADKDTPDDTVPTFVYFGSICSTSQNKP